MLFGFLFGTAGRHRAFQAAQHRGPRTLCHHGFRGGMSLVPDVQQRVQLHQPGRFDLQIIFIQERLAHFLSGGGLLLVKVLQLVFDRFQTLGHLRQGVVDTGKISARVCTQGRPMGHLPFQQECIFLFPRLKFHRHSESTVTADLHRIGGFDLLTGIQQGCTGIFFVGQHIAPDLHTGKAICRVWVRGQCFQIGFKSLNIPLVGFDFLREVFPYKVQKISINAGFTCPNRDGTKGFGGCTYCNNQTFSPEYCHTEKSVTEQLEAGVRFFSRKYPEMKYLAYFQAYTNTYDELDSLTSKYEEALACPGVVGLIVGTRPDCMPDALLDYFSTLSQKKFVMIEYGLESTLDRTLTRINRGHTHAESEEAIRRTAARNIYTGAHLILGLPGESREEILHHADILSALPLTTLKLHQLQLIRGTRMAREQAEHPEQFHLYTADEYIDLVIDFIERLNPSIVVERFVSQSPKELLIAPDWGLKNFEFTAKVNKRISERNARQGRLLNPPSSEPVLPGM